MQSDDVIDNLLAFKIKNKFSDENWEARGLNPSNPDISQQIEIQFNRLIDVLINTVSRDSASKRLKSILKNGLKEFDKSDYDTEEKELIADLFIELAQIVNIDIKEDVTRWSYGALSAALLRISRFIKPERIVETIKQPCTNCGVQLETYVKEKQEEIPSVWIIAKCNNCNELNLISTGPNVKNLRFGEYLWIETLNQNEYTEEQAFARFEQIKFFRK